MNKTLTILIIAIAVILPFAGISCSGEEPSVSTSKAAEKMVREGAEIFRQNCQVCHGEGGKGDICPDLTDSQWKYGNSEADLYTTISKGRPGGMPSWENTLGKDKIKKVISYIRSISGN